MARRIKLMTDYHCHPLWDYGDSGDLYGNPDPAELPLTPGTIEALRAWAAWFDSFLDADQPNGVRDVLPDEDAAFKQTGQQLWATLQYELGPAWHVVYFEDGNVLEPAG